MAKCDFCGTQVPMGTGKLYVRKEGKQLYFCSMKCEKNMLKLRRKPWETKWTEESRKKRGSQK